MLKSERFIHNLIDGVHELASSALTQKRQNMNSCFAFSSLMLEAEQLIHNLYITLITAVNTTEPIVKINIVHITTLVTFAKVLVSFFSRID
jgi:hypothetical protein